MKYFDINNPPKRLRISQLTLPEQNWFTFRYSIQVPNPFNSLSVIELRNFNKFSAGQLAEYQAHMKAKWGDLVLTLIYSDSYKAEYRAVYASKYRNMLRDSDIAIARSLKSIGNNDN